MRLRCPACGLTFEREPGYFVGAIYLNYAATALLAILGYFVVHAWLAPPVTRELLLWGAFVVLFPLWFYRYSKCLWLSLDHLVDPVEPRGDR